MNSIRQYLRTYDITSSPNFLAIQELVLCRLTHVYGVSSFIGLTEALLNTSRVDLRDDIRIMLELDNYLRKLLRELGIISDFIQFPANLRVFSSQIHGKATIQPYNTDLLHCDHWSTAPSDSINIFLYVSTVDSATYLAFYEYDVDQIELVRGFRGPYKRAPILPYTEFQVPKGAGLLYSWDCCVPHRTVRRGPGVTVSLDLRLRNISDVFMSDLNLPLQEWSRSRMTDLGVYWFNTHNFYSSLQERIEEEIFRCSAISPALLERKLDYLSRHYPGFS
jgi:hypothetical protein